MCVCVCVCVCVTKGIGRKIQCHTGKKLELC